MLVYPPYEPQAWFGCMPIVRYGADRLEDLAALVDYWRRDGRHHFSIYDGETGRRIRPPVPTEGVIQSGG